MQYQKVCDSMILKLEIDKSCNECKQGLQLVKFYTQQKSNKNFYGGYNFKTSKLLKKLIVTPDFNSCGNLTHWHIEPQN